jgi:transporter family protein
MKMEGWLFFSLATVVFWGFWGFFPKVASKYLDARSLLVFQLIGSVIIGVVVLFTVNFNIQNDMRGTLPAILGGLAVTLGSLTYILAVSSRGGSTPVVVTISALYPVVTIILSMVILHETITLKQGVGILLATAAMILFAL